MIDNKLADSLTTHTSETGTSSQKHTSLDCQITHISTVTLRNRSNTSKSIVQRGMHLGFSVNYEGLIE